MVLIDTKHREWNMIDCKCGCGTQIPERDNKNRLRQYARGHNDRKKKDLTRICKQCGLSYDRFGPKRGTYKLCKSCYGKTYHKLNKDKLNEQKKLSNRKLRTRVLDLLGNKCVCCKETKKEFLAINHIKGNGKDERQAVMLYRKILKMENPHTDYNILCHNCNISLGLYGYCPHTKGIGHEINP